MIGQRLFQLDDPAVSRLGVAFEDNLIDDAEIVVGVLGAVRKQIRRVDFQFEPDVFVTAVKKMFDS